MEPTRARTRALIIALLLVSLGGLLLHARVHPVFDETEGTFRGTSFFPLVAGLLSVVVTPLLLSFRRTLILGYVFNGMTAIVGSILMTYFSLALMQFPVTLERLIIGTTLADVLILLSKLFIGQQILLAHYPAGTGRMFTSGWWFRHFVYLSVVFTVGHFLWR